MAEVLDSRKRSNLYYIFAEDKDAHPMPTDRAEILREKMMEKFLEKTKPP